MEFNAGYAALLIFVAAAVTFGLRAVPFVFFGGKREMPEPVKKVADLMPAAIIAVLVIYCLKGAIVTVDMNTLASALGAAAVVLLHVWKRNMLLSIFGGTAVYMLLLHLLPGMI
ncbi:MAG: AzlD domain-containing protein [Firmicutes bacterium]|nr:AzlD domain-containing protein [Bacillota bacterium]